MIMSEITNIAKATLAMPLAVIKAMFTLERSFELTIEC
jgi:hypothetical protein